MNTLYKLNMNNHLNILDIPNEILYLIFQELNTTDVFYSLADINRRFNRLIFDSLYIRDLNMTTTMNINSLYDESPLIDPQILSKICSKNLS